MISAKDLLNVLDGKRAGVVLILGLSALCLVLQREIPGFTAGHHGRLSAHGMVLAANMSLAQRGFTFDSARVDADGTVSRTAYNRFPTTSFLLVKAAMGFAKGNMRLEILYARVVMMLFFLGGLLCAYLGLYHVLPGSQAAASTALLTFASWHLGQYNDMVFNDVPTLFGMLLCFHGMVVHSVQGRRLQLYVKALVAVSLGWQSLALLAPYAVFGLVRCTVQRRSFLRIVFCHEVLSGLLGLLAACGILAFSVWNEAAITGEPFRETSTVRSAQFRTGMDAEQSRKYSQHLEWGRFTRLQFYRVGRMCYPNPGRPDDRVLRRRVFQTYGVIACVAALAAAACLRQRVVMFALICSGVLWAVPMRAFTAFHDFQTIFYVGFPLVLFWGASAVVSRWGPRLLPALLGVAVAAFLLSFVSLQGDKARKSEWTGSVTEDFQTIAGVTGKGRRILASDVPYRLVVGRARDYYLSGSYHAPAQQAEFAISANPKYKSHSLTPGNRCLFLAQKVAAAPTD
jgi:hypothetical protein